MEGIRGFFAGTPPVTGTIFCTSFILSCLTTCNILSVYDLTISWPTILSRHEYWRFYTALVYFGNLNLNLIISFFQNMRYVSMLESQSFSGRFHEFFFFILYTWVSLTIFSYFLDLRLLSQPFMFVMVYLWSRRNPTMLINIFGLVTFQAKYYPLIQLGIAKIQGQDLTPLLFALFVGHVYFFLEDIYPQTTHNGTRPIQKFVRFICRIRD